MQIGKIPYGRQTIEKDDIAAVTETLKSDFLTQGPQVPKFEEAVASYCGAKHACAVNSGTSALHVAYLALGVRPGSRVWTTPVTFVATSNAALMCGAEVSFIDVDPMTGNISTTALAASLQTAARDHELPDVVTVVHLGGLPCDMKKISELAALYHFRVIEDCCHALGSEYRGEMIGSCRYSDISVFSFHPVKAITTGEGGMALTNNEKLWQRMKLLSSHGITKDDEVFEEKPDGGWYYEQQMLGFNYRMPDISAALGISRQKAPAVPEAPPRHSGEIPQGARRNAREVLPRAGRLSVLLPSVHRACRPQEGGLRRAEGRGHHGADPLYSGLSPALLPPSPGERLPGVH